MSGQLEFGEEDHTATLGRAWELALHLLASKVSTVAFATYIQPVQPLTYIGKVVTLGVANAFFRERLEKNHANSLRSHALAAFAHPCAAKKTPSGKAGRFVIVAWTHALPGRKTPEASRARGHTGRHAGRRLEVIAAGSRIAHCSMLTVGEEISQLSSKTPSSWRGISRHLPTALWDNLHLKTSVSLPETSST